MTEARKSARHLSISATDAEWDVVRDNAARRGLPIGRYLVGLVERDGRARDGTAPALALNAAEQHELLDAVREVRALLAGRGDPRPLAEDMQARVAVTFASWADGMLDDGRADDLRAALAAVRGEGRAEADLSRLARDRARRRDAGGRGRKP